MTIELNYSRLAGHEPMLRDSIRCKAFRQAIVNAVTPGCTVLDIGAGTGILSIFAAQAGAGVVYAVERTGIAELAKYIIQQNKLEDKIQVLHDDIENIELPGKVDVIVSEWLGGYGVDENLLPVVLLARDRWLKPGGKMIPETVSAWMAPAQDAYLQQDVDFWQSEPYGINLDVIGENSARQADWCCNHIKQEHLACAPKLMWHVDSNILPLADASKPFEANMEFVAERDSQFNVLAAWFSSELDSRTILANGPADPDTHWGRSIFPIGKTVSVKRGTRINVHFILAPDGKNQSVAKWSLEVDGYSFSSEGITLATV
ncbi:MAG: class I SAM-dependent methyltransferase [Victivallaceae bacterium]